MAKLLRLVLTVCIATVLSVGAPLPVTATSQGWLSGWDKRIQLTIDHAKINATLSDFPVLVHLGSNSGINKSDVSSVFDALKTDDNRCKIAITAGDGLTELYVEIERWDTANKQAWVWVKVPSISATADTILYLYFDVRHEGNQNMVGDSGSIPAQKVWNTNYVMVQHLEQAGNTSPRLFKDSTSHQNDGFEDHGKINATPQSTPSVIGMGQAFDNSACITIPDRDDFSVTTTGELTVSYWLSESVPNFESGGLVNIMGKGAAGRYEWSFFMYQRDWTDRSQRISFYMDNPKGGLGSGSYTQKPIAVNDWVHITATVDNEYTYIYRNGVLAGKDHYVGPDAYVQIFPQNGNEPVRIGTRDFGTWFEGRIDEVRVSNVSRSSEYIVASYQSDTDNLIRFGAVQNDQPVFNPVADKFIDAGEPLTFGIRATNKSFKPLTYTASNLPSGASFDVLSETFSWVPQANQVGTYIVRFDVTDGLFIGSIDVKIMVTEAISIPPPPTANQSDPDPPTTNISGPDPSTANESAPASPTANESGPDPSTTNISARDPSTTNESAPAPTTANESGPDPSTTNISARDPSTVNQTNQDQPVSLPDTGQDNSNSDIHYGWIMAASGLLGALMIITVAAAIAMRHGQRSE